MSKTIEKIRTLGSARKASSSERQAKKTSGIDLLSKNVEPSLSDRSVAHILSLGDQELANVALHTAYVEKVKADLTQEAITAVPGLENAPEHEYLRGLIEMVAKLKAEVQYVREELNGVPLSHARAKSVDPVAFMGTLDRGSDIATTKFYEVDFKNGFVGNNWYGAEGAETSYWRWSGPNNSSTVLLPSLGGGVLRFELSLRPINPEPAFAKSLRVYVNGVEADLGDYVHGDMLDLAFSMDVGVAAPYEKLVLRVEIDRTYSPHDLVGTKDHRKLGVAMFRCAIFSEVPVEI